MRTVSTIGVGAILLVASIATRGAEVPSVIVFYELPDEVRQSLMQLAAESDLLVLGETHGTRETPAIAAGLLESLSALGYGALALEIPSDLQQPLTDWVTGTSQTLPEFFTRPPVDGRESVEMLALIRMALSQPLNWKLICFDQTEAAQRQQAHQLLRDAKQDKPSNPDAGITTEIIALGNLRDAAMADTLAGRRRDLPQGTRVLAICGNLHARVANRTAEDSPIHTLWPSFAATVQANNPTWRVRSVNIDPRSGGYFNGGKVQTLRGQPIDSVQGQLLDKAEWNFELALPRGTPATFLTAPSDAVAPPPATGSASSPTRSVPAGEVRP